MDLYEAKHWLEAALIVHDAEDLADDLADRILATGAGYLLRRFRNLQKSEVEDALRDAHRDVADTLAVFAELTVESFCEKCGGNE